MLGPTSKGDLAPRLAQSDYAVFKELSQPTDTAFTRLDLHQCTQCRVTTTLTATTVRVTLKKGKQERDETALLTFLLVPPSDLGAMKTFLAGNQPPGDPATPTPASP